MAVRAKQLAAATFTETEVDRTFAAQAIDGDRIKNAAVTEVQLSAGAFGTSLVGGAGTVVDLETNTDNYSPTFTGAGAWTFSADRLQVTGTPDSANDAVNKTYVDNAISGVKWKTPVHAGANSGAGYIGTATVAEINGLTPATGDIVVAEDAGTPTAGASDALVAGDVAEFDGTQWQKIIGQVGGFPPDGVLLIVATSSTFVAGGGLTDATDEGKVAEFDGTALTPATLTSPDDGNARLVKGVEEFSGPSPVVNENQGYVFDGAVPTGTWVQFTGAGQVNAGAGLTKSGNTLNVGDANKGIQVNADDLQVDASEIAGSGLEQTAGAGNEHLLKIKPDSVATDESDAIGVSANGLKIDGDKIDIDFTPTNYTPDASPAEADDVDDLTAHLKGIDTALDSAAETHQQEEITTEVVTGTDTALADTLSVAPVNNASVKLYLNGILQVQGAGKDYTISGQTITWLAATGTAVDMDATDVLVAVYKSD